MFLFRPSSSRGSSWTQSLRRVRSQSTSSSSSRSRPFPVLKPSKLEISSSSLSLSKDLTDRHLEHVALCRAGGGDKGIQRHTKVNKKILVRDRIKEITDPGTEHFELGTTAGLGLEYGDVPCAGTVTTIGQINGVHCMIIANDGTVKGGATYPIGVTKSVSNYKRPNILKKPL